VAHVAVAQTEEAFRNAVPFFMEAFFDNFPGVMLYEIFHIQMA
jgi:hypothetical protein